MRPQIFERGLPPPLLFARSQYPGGELLKRIATLGARKRRETAIAHHLAGDSLANLFRAIRVKNLKIQMAVKIDETGRDHEAGAIQHFATNWRHDVPNLDDPRPVKQHRRNTPRTPGAIDQQSILQKEHKRVARYWYGSETVFALPCPAIPIY